MTVHVDRVVTSGFTVIDDRRVPLSNNTWVIGDDAECLVIDASHEDRPVLEAIASRRVRAVLCTHGHRDHIYAAVPVGAATAAPVLIHSADSMLWHRVHESPPDGDLVEGQRFDPGLSVIHTPGHTPGSVCLYSAEFGVLFTGDTLFPGGPGATGRPFSDFDSIIASIRERLFVLPPETVVHPGHGESTTIGRESPSLADWIARGY